MSQQIYALETLEGVFLWQILSKMLFENAN